MHVRVVLRRWLGAIATDRRMWLLGALVVFGAALAFRLARRAAGYWEIDDAGITDAAALQLADHHSLSPFLEGPALESYSNPLVFFVITLLRLFGRFDPVATHLTLETIVFAIMVLLVWSALRHWIGEVAAVIAAIVFTALELLVPATWIWYGSGLENVWVAAGLVLLLWLCLRTARGVPLSAGWGNAIFLVAITRPEGPVYVAGCYAVLLVVVRPAGRSLREHARLVARPLIVTSALYLAFLVWRYLAYRSLFPNTYYAKLAGKSDPIANIHDYVAPVLLPYCRAGLFAGSAVVLLMVRRFERFAHCLLAFALFALALPIAAGADFMGEHRFGTPFIAIGHVAYAAVVAVCIARVAMRFPWRIRLAHVTLVAVVLLPGLLLGLDHLTTDDGPELSLVTVPRIAELNGAARWEHQMRLGLPDAVVMTPDVGGALLVGSMQLVDSGYLADFDTPRMGRDLADPLDRAEIDQYEHEERRPDLVDDNGYFPTDKQILAARYAVGGGRFLARRDLVELSAIPEGAVLLFNDPDLRIYLSPSTVTTAGPGGLVRCELVIAWTGIQLDDTTRLSIDLAGDHDEIGLRPYVASATGIERRALLIGAPERPGSYPVVVQVARPGQSARPASSFSIEVTRDDAARARAAAALTAHVPPLEAARRIAWLREQAVPRLGMRRFYMTVQALQNEDQEHAARAGERVMKLRWNARLGDLQPRAPAIRAAELAAVRGMFATCPAQGDRVMCLGRSIDELRRLGYLRVRALVPDVERELAAARGTIAALPLARRYQALVGLVLSDPSDLALHHALLAVRRALVESHQPSPSLSR